MTAHLTLELDSKKSSQAEMQRQLSTQIAEIQALRESLTITTSERRVAEASRATILASVSSLQTDLNQVRKLAGDLGTELGNIREERDSMELRDLLPAHQAAERTREELTRVQHRLAAAEAALDHHVCPK